MWAWPARRCCRWSAETGAPLLRYEQVLPTWKMSLCAWSRHARPPDPAAAAPADDPARGPRW